jgi:TPR repeat protein
LVKAAEAASTVSGQSATDQRSANQRSANQRSANQRAQARSLPELRKLAAQGDADAQWQLGVRYHNGEDVPRDDVQAMQWFLRAAEQGHVTAQATLGAYYWAGRGVPQDLSKAYFWSALALAQGDENSKSRLEGLASQMTQAQVSAARQQAEVWLHSHSQRAKSEAN